MSSAVAAQLLGVKQTTISKYVNEYYEREGKIISLRGFVHDIVRSTTHKRWIIELYLNGYTTKEIHEKTDHDIASIDRYLKRYLSVVSLVEELNTADSLKVARMLGISERSAREYIAIYLEYKETSKIKRIDYYKEIEKATQGRLEKEKNNKL